jgi:hypothetical protein
LGKGSLIGLVLLAGCSSTPVAEQPAPRTVELAEQNQPIGTRMPQADTDLCKAGEFQWLVGRPRTEIPVPVEVVNRRVACTSCPVTEDYSPYRLNIFYNSQSDLVEQVRCG